LEFSDVSNEIKVHVSAASNSPSSVITSSNSSRASVQLQSNQTSNVSSTNSRTFLRTDNSTDPDSVPWTGLWDGYAQFGERGCTESAISNEIVKLKANGLFAAGINMISINGGGFSGRDANGLPTVDPVKFPHGFPWLANFIHTNGFYLRVYGILETNVGLSDGTTTNCWIYGAENSVANYFITNHVDAIQLDSPIGTIDHSNSNHWPNEVDWDGNEVTPMLNTWDESYLKFRTAFKKASWPTVIDGSFKTDGSLTVPPNIKSLCDTWRIYDVTATNALGQALANDGLGLDRALVLWNITDKQTALDGMNTEHCAGIANNVLMSDWQNMLYYTAEFCAPQYECLKGDSPNDPTFTFHNWTNELASAFLASVKSDRARVSFCYSNNGCYFFAKDDMQGGKFVLVQNRNSGAGIGSTPLTAGSGYPSGSASDRWRTIDFTNAWANGGTTNYLYFWMTNSTLDFTALGCGQKCVVTSSDFGNYGNCAIDAVGSLPITVYAGGSRIYHVQPVSSFAQNSGIASLIGMPYFDFYSETDNPPNPKKCEPWSPQDNYMESPFIKKREMSLCGTASYSLNGAKRFVAVMGVDNGLIGQNGVADFYVDGNLVLTAGPYTTAQQFTNIVLNFGPTNQVLTISSRDTIVCFQNPLFVYQKPGSLSFLVNSNSVIPPRHITMQWSCGGGDHQVTGIVSAPTPAGPWHPECQFPLTNAVNTWTDTNVTPPAKFYRVFIDWVP
jgi:hypothetical protein